MATDLPCCDCCLQGASASDLVAAKPVAAAVASEFIRSSEMFQFDLLDNPAVKALAGDAQHGTLYQLLSIFLSGTVQVGGWEVGPMLGWKAGCKWAAYCARCMWAW